jgi:hypothetical protein
MRQQSRQFSGDRRALRGCIDRRIRRCSILFQITSARLVQEVSPYVLSHAANHTRRLRSARRGSSGPACSDTPAVTDLPIRAQTCERCAEVTRKRMYLETMERIMSDTDKIIIGGKFGQGIVPVLGLGRGQTKSP